MIGEALEVLKAAGTGGVMGVAGVLFGEIAGYAKRRQDNKHELALLKLEQKGAAEEAEMAADLVETMGADQRYLASVQHDAGLTGAAPWVQSWRAGMRPFLTLESWLAMQAIVLVAYIAPERTAQALQIAQIAGIVETITTAGVGFGTWWFGERMMSKHRAAG